MRQGYYADGRTGRGACAAQQAPPRAAFARFSGPLGCYSARCAELSGTEVEIAGLGCALQTPTRER